MSWTPRVVYGGGVIVKDILYHVADTKGGLRGRG